MWLCPFVSNYTGIDKNLCVVIEVKRAYIANALMQLRGTRIYIWNTVDGNQSFVVRLLIKIIFA